jgi:hypothetical protein
MNWFAKSTLESMSLHLDLSRAVPNERFTCLTCHRTGPLTVNGKCGACNSDAVITVAVMK